MTFLIDPFLLTGLALLSIKIGQRQNLMDEEKAARLLAFLSLLVIVFTSSSLYLDAWWMNWFWQPFQPYVTSGKDLMINSGIFSFETEQTNSLIDLLAFIQIAVYPLWTFIGFVLHARMSSMSRSEPN